MKPRNAFSILSGLNRLRRGIAFLFGFAPAAVPLLFTPPAAFAFALAPIYGVDQNGVFTGMIPASSIDDGARWDTTSLGGGLSYNFGEWSATAANLATTLNNVADFFAKFGNWVDAKPSLNAFSAAVNSAFSTWANAWQPSGGPISFTKTSANVGTGVSSWTSFALSGNNLVGNEIDILATSLGAGGAYGLTPDFGTGDDVHLTNGFGYASIGGLFPSSKILAVDIALNSDTTWTLPLFTFVLTHELGHALGLGDVDAFPGSSSTSFWDTDNDVSNIMPINTAGDVRDDLPVVPARPALSLADADGKILMCSTCPTRLTTLQNDDSAGIHFLYPVPEPGTLALLGLTGAILAWRRRVT